MQKNLTLLTFGCFADHVYAIVRTTRGRPTWSMRATWYPWALGWWPLL